MTNTTTQLIDMTGNACLFSEENLARILGFKGVCNAQNL